jgi:Uma2 family endonuclease
MSAALKTKLTPQEYLARERAASFRSEFYRGEMFAMAGARLPHNRIVANLLRLIGNQLAGGRCFVLANDMRVKCPSFPSYFYPDVTIVCGKAELEDDTFDTLTNPQVIMEIQSETTSSFDEDDKFDEYRSIASLQEYVIISQKKMQLLRYVRQEEDHWDLRIFKDQAGTFRLESVKVAIPLKEIYEGVEFPVDKPT